MRPLGLGEMLDAGFKVVITHFRVLVLIVLAVMVPLEILTLLITTSVTTSYEVVQAWDFDSTAEVYDDTGTYVAGQIAIFVLTFVFSVIATVAVIRVVTEAYLDRSAGVWESIRYVLSKWRQVIWTSLFLVVPISIGLAFCLVPGVWLAVLWVAALPALMVEGVSGPKALSRSQQLLKDRWWATFGRLLVAGLIWLVISIFVELILGALLTAPLDSNSIEAMIAESFAYLVATAITTPLLAAIIVIIYFDLRVRKEGFDLQILAERMGGGDAASSPFSQRAVDTPASAPSSQPPAPDSGEGFGGFSPPAPPSDSG